MVAPKLVLIKQPRVRKEQTEMTNHSDNLWYRNPHSDHINLPDSLLIVRSSKREIVIANRAGFHRNKLLQISKKSGLNLAPCNSKIERAN